VGFCTAVKIEYERGGEADERQSLQQSIGAPMLKVIETPKRFRRSKKSEKESKF
jgi:hypothetical protein